MRYVDVKNDVAFRKIFGNEKKKIILISFLNAVLGLEGTDRIRKVTLLNPYQFPRIVNEKASIIDVKAIDGKGATFIVEMQVAEVDGFQKRVLYYQCKDYASQILVGDEYPKLRPVYFIGILDFNYFSGKNYLSKHLIVDGETGECVFKDMQFRFIELGKFKKDIGELENVIDQWTYFIKNALKIESVPADVVDEGLKEAYGEAERFRWTKNQYDAYIKAGIARQDRIGEITFAEKKGRKLAEAEKDKVIEEKDNEIAAKNNEIAVKDNEIVAKDNELKEERKKVKEAIKNAKLDKQKNEDLARQLAELQKQIKG